MKFTGNKRLSDQIQASNTGPIRQIVSQDRLTDIVVKNGNKYQINSYDLSAKGAKGSDGTYVIAPGAIPIRSLTVENPGSAVIIAPADPQLYAQARYEKKLSYALPVSDNNYTVQLYFSEPYHTSAGKAAFDVVAQGQKVLSHYDPYQATGGKNIGKVETVSAAVTNGLLSLDFNALQTLAHVSAIKVLSAGGAAPVSTPDSSLYTSSHLGSFIWQTNLPNGNYNVTLYFAESVYTAAGKRVFNVTANGQPALTNYDIYASAGGINRARQEIVPAVVTAGQLTLQFTSVTGDSRLCALSVSSADTGAVVAAVNAGGPAYTSGAGVSFAPDSGFSGGVADAPGRLVLATKAGPVAVAADGTVFASDESYVTNKNLNGYVVDGSLTRMRVTKQEVGRPDVVSDYNWSTDPQSGKFGNISLGDSMKQEGRQIDWAADGQSYDQTDILSDGSGNVVTKTITTYAKFSFGLGKVKEQNLIDASGNALVTTWDYYEQAANPADPKPNGYGQVKSMKAQNGYWETYTYDSNGTLIKTVSQYLNSAFGDEATSKVETLVRTTANPVETHITKIQGQEVARSYRANFDESSANQEYERRTITCLTPGAAWTATDNLVSSTRSYTSNHADPAKRGQTKWSRQPDGTMTVYSYALTSTTKTVTSDRGAPSATFPATDTSASGAFLVTAGTRTLTTTNSSGQTIAQDTRDIASGLTLQSWTALTVDGLGRVTQIGYGDGTTSSKTYVGSAASCGTCSSSGNFLIASETDRNGITTTYGYDALNRRTDTITLGVTTHVVYDAANRVLETHRIGSDNSDILLAKTVYDLAGRTIETDDALGNATTYAYTYPSGGGRVTTKTLPATAAGAGTRIETAYGDGKTASLAGTAVSPVNYAYGVHSLGEWTQEIKVRDDGALTEWTKTYTDLAGRTLTTEYPATTATAVATLAYNALGQLVAQTDPDSVKTLYAYNSKGEREVTAIDLNRNGVIDYTGVDRITKTVRDVLSQSGAVVNRTTTQVWATDSVNTATTVSIATQDGYGNQSTQTDAAGAVSTNVIARTAAGAWTVTALRSDGSRQVQTYTSGLLATSATLRSSLSAISSVTYAYDPHNRVSTQTDARIGATSFTYSLRDEVLTTKVNNAADTTINTYDALGNLLTRTLPDASVTTNTYYLLNNQLNQTSGSQTYPVSYTYDSQGRMKTLTTWQNATTSAGAAVTTWNYDPLRGWLAQKLYADNTGPSYTYTPAGRLLTRTWARTVSSAALVTTYGYNNAGDLSSTTYSDGTTPAVGLTYTRFGAQKTLADAAGTRTLTYNAALRPNQEQFDATYYSGRILTRTYETTGATIGRATGFQLGVSGTPAQDYSVTYGYDTAGRLGTVTDPANTFTYGYLPNSNLRLSLSSAVNSVAYSYEPYRDVIASLENKVGTTSISKYAYIVNNLGQRTERANTGTAFATASTDVFAYNAKGEVTGSTNATLTARNQSFVYDDIGNRTSFVQNSGTTSYTANTLNQYTAIGSFVPTVDADGNTTATGSGQVYTWDAENRLTSVAPLTPATGNKKILNTYDGQSRRVRKQSYTYTSGAWVLSSDEKYLYDGWNLVAVLDASSPSPFTLRRTYTWGLDLSGSLQGAGGVGGLLSAKDGSSVYNYTYDANGNVSEVLNNSGSIVAHYEYSPFGSVAASSGSYAATNLYRFSTKPVDSESGLSYYGLRYYNPGSGRWLNRDPIEEEGGVNLYGFVENDPVFNFDLLGQKIPWKSLINGNYTYSIPLYNPYVSNFTISLSGSDLNGCCFRVQLTGTLSKTLNLSRLFPAAKDLVTAEVGITIGGSIKVCMGSNGEYAPAGDAEGIASAFGSGSIGAGSRTTSRGRFQDFGGYGTPFPGGSSVWKESSDNGLFGSVSIHGDIVYNFSTESLNREKTGVFVDASFGYRFGRHSGSWSSPSKKIIPSS